MTTGELELEFQLMRRNNPSMNEEQLREAMFRRAMESTCDELADEVGEYSSREILRWKGKIR